MNNDLRTRLRFLAAPFILAFACLLIYNANLRQIGAGDTVAARYLPLVVWHNRTLELDANAHLLAHGHPLAPNQNRPVVPGNKAAYFEPEAYWLIRTRDHHLASFYPVVAPLMVAPLYLPVVRWLDQHGWEQPRVDRVAEWMEKLAASILAALASVLVFLVLRREGNPWSVPLTLAFAFGTNTWMISSQALWQHGSGELLVALALLLVLGPATALRSAAVGLVCVLMAANRPPDALIAAAFGLFVVWRNWRSAPWLIAGAIGPLAAVLYYNVGFMGDLAGGYGLVKPPLNFFQSNWSGVAGMLFSPARGLLVFAPFLLFLPLGLRERLGSPSTRGLAIALTLAALAQLMLYSHADWRAGTSWGPRWLTDLLPILVWILAPAPMVMRPIARRVLVVAIAFSVAVQAVGAFWYTKTSDELLFASGSMDDVWNPANFPFITELRHARAPGELLCDAMGSIDLVGDSLHPSAGKPPELKPGAVIEGWSLACERAPAQVALLVDGVLVGTTTEFLQRPDVDAAMHTHAPSGWKITSSLWGVAPGERVMQLAVRVEPRSDFRIVREQPVFVIAQQPVMESAAPPTLEASALNAMAARAAWLLREHQTEYGAWLTAYTPTLNYEAPQPELNTFLTSMLVDLLTPIAQQQGLDYVMGRARTHLGAQIESDGLVRYHGLPDAPTIGKLGCAITPDADDTALVWRIIGRVDDPRRARMLDTLSHYRDVRGLFRTWLAAPKNYQCLDPGRDPNPTDITIQMHVYLMLREFDPPAAQALCKAIQREFRDEDVWVYYAQSALLPYLRAAELRQLGCTLPLPTERLAQPSVGQDIWSQAVRRLVEATATPQDPAVREAILSLLGQLASDDFATIRRTPPLLYHNDLHATVSRFYWSEDVGYALWLRLYQAVGPNATPTKEKSP